MTGREFRFLTAVIVLAGLLSGLVNAGLYQVSSIPTSEEVLSADWSPDERYLVSGRQGNAFISELSIFSYSSQVLAQAAFLDFGMYTVNATRWHPSTSRVAVATVTRTPGDELLIYNVDTAGGNLSLYHSTNVGREVTALAWHPSGDYLAVGYAAGSSEVAVFHVAPTGLSMVATGGVIPDISVSREALDWDPAGTNLVIGFSAGGSGVAGLQVYGFHPTNPGLTLVVGQAPSETVTAVDWAAGTNLIAAGFADDWQSTIVHIYELSSTNTLNTRAFLSSLGRPAVLCLNWGPADDVLAVSWGVSSGLEIELYSFNGAVLGYLTGWNWGSEHKTIRWSGSGDYLAGSDSFGTGYIRVFTTTEVDRVLGKYSTPGSLVSGSNLTYTLVVTNLGPQTAYGVRISDPLPDDVSFVSAGASQGSCVLSNTTVICELGMLAAGASAVATVHVHVAGTAKGVLTNEASLIMLGNDINAANDIAFALTLMPDTDGDGVPDFVDDDDDGDGMPDDYEILYFGGRTNASPLADGDGDSFNNLDEYVAGSNPTLSNSYFRLSGIARGIGTSLRFDSFTGRHYDVWYTTNLARGVWIHLATNVAGAGGVQVIEDPSAGQGRAYRLGVRKE